jgi:hypothetical protein
MTPFPAAFPVDSVQVVVAHLRGTREAELCTLVNAGWDVLGYALGHAVGCQAPHPHHGEFDLAAALEAAHTPQGVGAPAAIPWGPIVQALMNYLTKLLLG